MSSKTQKNKKTANKTRKVSKRVLEMWEDPETVWGKNKPLEKFWEGLAANKYVIVIYKNGKHKKVNMPNVKTKQFATAYNEFDENPEVEAVLSSNLSQDAYEVHLYPKAKDKSVEYVIKNYKKYFKPMHQPKQPIEGVPLMKKVRLPS